MKNLGLALLNDESGQGVVEYALVLFLVSIVAIATMNTLGAHVTDGYKKISSALPF